MAASTAQLQHSGQQFGGAVEQAARQLDTVAAQAGSSAVELASLGEAFGAAVQQFGHSNQALVDQLQRTEAALAKASARSDDQLAYCVAQAREIIDLALLSQQQTVAELQRALATVPVAAAEPA